MNNRAASIFFTVFFLLTWGAFSLVSQVGGAETLEAEAALLAMETNILHGTATNLVPPEETVTAEEARRSYLKIQNQMDTALAAMERNRREAQAAAERSKAEVETRLKTMESTFEDAMQKQTGSIQDSNQNMMRSALIIAGSIFFVMMIFAVFQVRSLSRLAGYMAAASLGRTFGPGAAIASTARVEEPLLGNRSGDTSGGRLLSAIEKLEKRVVELEHTAQVPVEENAERPVNGSEPVEDGGVPSSNGSQPTGGGQASPTSAADPAEDASALCGKGQALLNLGQIEQALTCFERALGMRPDDAETLVRKGTALEKLERWDEAVECYDRAIALNQSLTLAYLYKGGLFNRLERYNEALACYEQALKTQQTTGEERATLPAASP
jgi:tetratricopeptide (TPR) repeat protein